MVLGSDCLAASAVSTSANGEFAFGPISNTADLRLETWPNNKRGMQSFKIGFDGFIHTKLSTEELFAAFVEFVMDVEEGKK